MKYKQAIEILRWWADTTATMVITGTTGHIYDVHWNPVTQQTEERWLGSNVFAAAGQIIVWRYQVNEPCPLQFHSVIAEAPGARERFGLK